MGLYNLVKMKVKDALEMRKNISYGEDKKAEEIINAYNKNRKQKFLELAKKDTQIGDLATGKTKIPDLIAKVESAYSDYPKNILDENSETDLLIKWLEEELDLNKKKNYVSIEYETRQKRYATASVKGVVAGGGVTGLSMFIKKLPLPLKIGIGVGSGLLINYKSFKDEKRNVHTNIKVMKKRGKELQEIIDDIQSQ